MNSFSPGLPFGSTYSSFIWVCINDAPRDFEKCRMKDSKAVWEAFNAKLHEYGLSREVFVFRSGCLLGCKSNGTTIAVACNRPETEGSGQVQFFDNVTADDVDTLIQLLFLKDA